jgi:hypothetical protein
MNLFKKLNLLFQKKEKLPKNSYLAKPFDEIYADQGAFKYTDDGFEISYGDFQQELRWADITEIDVYKSDLMIYDQIEMRIVNGDKFFTISEELPGWYQFIIKTKEIFPDIAKDWDLTIPFPPFATNYTVIYKK